ncbi:MAG: hypothetical protein IPO43_06185 [Rhodoferax sp.]|nr:hypothetical protein [Rhodoferax sp.]
MNEPQLFLVRVWQHLSQFRAAVRGVDETEPRLFDEPAQLGEYLRQASAEPSPAIEGEDALASAGQTPGGHCSVRATPHNPARRPS